MCVLYICRKLTRRGIGYDALEALAQNGTDLEHLSPNPGSTVHTAASRPFRCTRIIILSFLWKPYGQGTSVRLLPEGMASGHHMLNVPYSNPAGDAYPPPPPPPWPTVVD